MVSGRQIVSISRPSRDSAITGSEAKAIEAPIAEVETIRILVADDHSLVRAGIRALVERIEGVEVVAETGDGREALRLIQELQPQIVLLDLTMPELNGFEVLERARGELPGVSMIVLSVHEAEEYAMRALNLGAMGYLPKSAASAELEQAIRTVAGKQKYISPELSRKMFLEHAKDIAQGRSPLAELTPRQLEVLRMIADGDSTKDIARKLKISTKTVESHRAQLMDRLNIHDVAGLVRYAIRMGLVTIEE
jgi:DNA-binding NarL/FixJ family response regulator